ncbi:MAG: single-stranded-DNA-specific exonuclease RecJ [Chloroflexi bacterium]|nr:single-stranded-DNA-specific exonuclease RecJ [Chloroflexota bacterium]
MPTGPRARRWVLAGLAPSAIMVGSALGLPTAIAQALHNRGLTAVSAAAAFLSEEGGCLHDPALLPDIDQALARLAEAALHGEVVAVYGDYDVDGVTGCALLTEVLEGLGCPVLPYIPDRATEGYGLNRGALRELVARGATLIVAVDCGSSDRDEIALAQSNGLDVVVIDHHEVPEDRPAPLALVNPRRADSTYPFSYLAAVGVAFKVAQALLARMGRADEETERRLLDLVALGTVADVAPLLDENRVLVKRGLAELNRTSRLGLQRLCIRAGVRSGSIDARAVGYVLGPRLNAAGRLRHAGTSFRLLLTEDKAEAEELASDLELTNQERQRMLQEAVQAARDHILSGESIPPLLLLCGEEYQAGIVGLVASRLVEEFYRPAIVIEQGEEHSRGSARSIPEFHITEALAGCREMLSRFGGHAQAAGFSIANDRLEAFEAAMLETAEKALADVDLVPALRIDAEVDLAGVDFPFYETMCRMAPFGHSNPTPIFLTRGLEVKEQRAVGQNTPNHLRLRLADGERIWSAIAFGRGEEAAMLPPRIDVVHSVVANDWNGLLSLELQVYDWREAQIE